MTNRERMLDLNRQAEDQTNRLRAMNRTQAQTQNTNDNIMRELGQQRDKIVGMNDMSDDIRRKIKQADSKTKQMSRRNVCIKCSLYVVIVVLFAAIVGSLIYKLTNR